MKLKSNVYTFTMLLLALIVAAGVGTLVSSCSGSEESIEVRSEWQLNMEGLAFNRDVIAVPAGKDIVLTLKNTDTYRHDFTIYATEAAERVMFEGLEVPAHTTKEYRFTAPKETGHYYFQNDAYAHKMNGTFIVSDQTVVRLEQ